ncbi:P2X purinoceptor 7-like [Saccostrea cucullata]|uniref:P2X purinoceptor 7-like n=1 Tax=Saccostrea cuccullata TaxID=36930 RepID=UPI002ECFEDF2
MDTEELRTVLRLVCSKQPSFMLDIMETLEGGGPEQPGSESRTAPSWCICTYCREMPTDREKVCCGKTRQNCQSRLPDFYTVVLDELVLEVALRYYNDVLAEPRDENINRSRRYAAYRQFIMWVHGKLGAGNRKVIPSCCVWRIRDTFPEPSGQYVGYLEGVMD